MFSKIGILSAECLRNLEFSYSENVLDEYANIMQKEILKSSNEKFMKLQGFKKTRLEGLWVKEERNPDNIDLSKKWAINPQHNP